VSGQRGLLAIVGGLIVVLVASVLVVILVGDRPPREYPSGSPESALQAYLAAWDEGDLTAAYAAFSRAATANVPFAEYRPQAADYRTWNMGSDGPTRRIFIDDVEINGDRATISVTIEETWVYGLNTSRNSYGREIPMVFEDDAWRIDELMVWLEPGFFAKY
jgi:hypothetical protein